MEESLLSSDSDRQPGDFDLLTSKNYQKSCRDSIELLLEGFRNGNRDISRFVSVFSRLLQARVDPPLEVIWCFALSRQHELGSEGIGVSDRMTFAQGLLRILSSCLVSSSGTKSTAALAPLVSELFAIVVSFLEVSGTVYSKKEKKLAREVDTLVDGISKYLSFCCRDLRDDSVVSSCSLADLVKVWSSLRNGEVTESGDEIRAFFPLVNDEVRSGICEKEFGLGVLAGIVIGQVFLLKICFKIIQRTRLRKNEKDVVRKELHAWLVGCITGSPNLNFYGILLRQLVAPTLPVTSLLDDQEENLLREILYDAVILPEYSFLKSEKIDDESVGYLRSLLLTKLVVTHKAIRLARSQANPAKAISYINAFSRSELPTKLIHCITNAAGIDKSTAPNIRTPQALLKWISNLEDKGLGEFVDNMSKLGIDMAVDEPWPTTVHLEREPKDDSDLFYINVEKEGKSEDQDLQSASSQFTAAAREMTRRSKGRKRKDLMERGEASLKFQKHDIDASPVKDDSFIRMDDDSNDGSEVENPSEDEDKSEADE